MKIFECIIDDKQNVFKTTQVGKSKKEVIEEGGGNGEFVRVKEVTHKYFSDTTVETLESDLLRCGWGDVERKLICALVSEHIENTRK